MQINKGFTLLETLTVTVIIGILASLSLGYYTAAKENVADREAGSSLRNIQVAEKSYRLDYSTYYPAAGNISNIGNINTNLKLQLPTVANRNWNYIVYSTGCARATRNGSGARSWFLRATDPIGTDPSTGVGCP